MKIEVKIKRTYFLVLISLLILFLIIFFVAAFNPGGLAGTFSKTKEEAANFGHSSDEVVVDISGEKFTLQQAIDSDLLSPTVSKRYICDGSKATEKFVSCTIPESNRWAGCFVVGFEAVEGGGAFDDGCFVTKTAANGPWQFIINQDGGEKIKCSARCITGNGVESFGATELTVNSFSSPPSPEPGGIPQ